MSDVKWKHHAKNPANQAFNIGGRKNLTKAKAWWQLGKSNNRSSKKAKNDE